MIDCGEDWKGKLPEVSPVAVLLTHAHPDHSGGLMWNSESPVYATEETWKALRLCNGCRTWNRGPVRLRRSGSGVAINPPSAAICARQFWTNDQTP
ncbi:MAG: MBL fold metallo-hydrolase [Acidobacteriota bacterium]